MKLMLGVALAVTVVICILVTPAGGFETRSASETLPLGFAAVGIFFIGVALDAAAVTMLALGRKRALTFATIGPVLFFPVVIIERIGFFSVKAPSPAIAALEVMGALTAAAAFALAQAAKRSAGGVTRRPLQRLTRTMANEPTKSWAHLSLYYLAGYAGPSGLALLFAPQLATHLLFSNGHYPDTIVRMVGVPLAALGLFVVQVVRLRLTQLHTTTLMARVFICASLVGLYVESADPMFLVLTGIVGFGFMLTLTGVLLDRRDAARAPAVA